MIFSAFFFFLKVRFKAFFHDENRSIQRKWKWTVKAPSFVEEMESEESNFFFYFVDVAAFLFKCNTDAIETRTGGGARTTCYANQKVSISNIPGAQGT